MDIVLSALMMVFQSDKPSEPIFALLLHQEKAFTEGETAMRAARVQEYTEWARSLNREGKLVAGEKLRDDGWVVTVRENRAAMAAELPGVGGGVAGYFVIRAANYAEAAKVAQTCPHIKYGGKILIRQIEH